MTSTNKNSYLLPIALILFLLQSCSWDRAAVPASLPEFCCGDLLPDEEGNIYKTIWIDYTGGNDVKLRGQCWMAENLKSGTFVPAFAEERVACTDCKYCMDNEPDSCAQLGGLYTKAMLRLSNNSDPDSLRDVCPEGWHVPTDLEWKMMERALGMDLLNLDSLTEENTRGTIASTLRNEERFNVQPTGFYKHFGGFEPSNTGVQPSMYWTSSTIGGGDTQQAIIRTMRLAARGIGRRRDLTIQPNAYCVRCVKND